MLKRAILVIHLVGAVMVGSAQSATVEFIKLDTETQGNWKGMYGGDGYNIIADIEAYPAYATVKPGNNSPWTWADTTTDVRALEKSGGGDRLAACWFNSSPWTIDIDLTDGRKHQVAIYFLDWDANNRETSVEVKDADTGEILDTHEMTEYIEGKYLVWEIRGHVVITIIHVASSNSVVSGLFFDKPENKGASSNPSPEDGLSDVARDVQLGWTPGEFAAQHDVYFGERFDDVNDAATADAAYRGRQDTTTFAPGILTLGQTYYWRIDEVNALPDATVFKGETWSFEVEPVSFALPIGTVSATASSSDGAQDPQNTVNGSGLSENDEHNIALENMWSSTATDTKPWIQFAFTQLQKLDRVHIWNHNSQTETILGFGIREALVETSLDGENWAELKTVELAQATGLVTYAGTEVALDAVVANFVRITAKSNWSILGLPQSGLSEVRFFAIPMRARSEAPPDGAVDVPVLVDLNWRAGREGVNHEVFLGTDPNALSKIATVESPGTTAAVDLDTTVYWQINEVNEAAEPAVWEGDLWSFDTVPYHTVDDMESYKSEDGAWVWETWTDGFDNDDNGALLGHSGNDVETVIVYEGSQSLPYAYGENGADSSEASRDISGDWSQHGIVSMSLMFYGNPANTPGRFYIKVNGAEVATYPTPADLTRAQWQAWTFDLPTTIGQANTLAIGLEGGSGRIYLDGIRLYPRASELIVPVDPDTTNLVGFWKFNESAGNTAEDSSGNGYHGTVAGDTSMSWSQGQEGNALTTGIDVYVSVPAAAWSSVDTQFTVAFWAKGSDALTDNWIFMAGNASGRLVSGHLPWGNEIVFDTTANWQDERIMMPESNDNLVGSWHHWTFIKNADTGEKQVYLDGRLYANRSASTTPIADVDRFIIGAGDAGVNPYDGQIDEFMLFNRALTAEEVLGVTGQTQPIFRPF
jgi:hypothetical protein